MTALRSGEGTPFEQALARRERDPLAGELDDLAAEINAEHQQVWRAGREALVHAVKCGKALLKAQEGCPTGTWLRWLEANVSVHPTSAYKYMRLARHADKVLEAGEGVQHALELVSGEPWHKRRALTDEDRAEMVRLAAAHSLEEIAETFGCAVSTVSRWTSPQSPARAQLLERTSTPERQPCPHCRGKGYLP